jgi:hypothetical protein
MELSFIPWLMAALTAVWFGWLAKTAGRNSTLWAVGGAAFALVVSTIVIGLGQAVSIPYSDSQRTADHVKWIASAVGLIAVLGWFLTSGIHRKNMALLRGQPSTPESGPGGGLSPNAAKTPASPQPTGSKSAAK